MSPAAREAGAEGESQPARPVIFIAEDVLDLLDEEQGRDRSREG